MKSPITVLKPEYSYLKMTPNNSIKNIHTDKIALAIGSLQTSFAVRITAGFAPPFLFKLIPYRWSISVPAKTSFYVYLHNQSAEFYFVVPTLSLSIIKEKIRSVWPTVTMSIVDRLPLLPDDSTKYSLLYTQEDALSLASKRSDNDLINSSLNTISSLEEDDEAGIFYNFIPTSQKGWRANYKNTISKIKQNQPTDKEKFNLSDFRTYLYILRVLSSILQSISNDISNISAYKVTKTATNYDAYPQKLNVSEDTRKKNNQHVVDTQIVVMSKSSSPLRQHNNAKSLAQSFLVLSEPEGGNSLRYKRYRKSFKPLAYSLPVERNKMSTSECQSFISLPGRELLERFPHIQKTDTQETLVPIDLRQGVMCIGKNKYRGSEQKAYLSTDQEYQQLTLVVVGPTRAGKTTLIGSLAQDAINNQECVIMFDFVENCESSSEVAQKFTKDKTLVISCADIECLQGLGYNESASVSSNPLDVYITAKRQTTQLLALINSINTEDKVLPPKMERYLTCASLITFCQNGSIKDVFDVLTNHLVRARYVRHNSSDQKENLEEYVMGLRELDEVDKTGEVTGTKFSAIAGVMDRLQKLKSNPYMELMLKKDTQGNLNLIEEIQKPQLIVLQMPEKMFGTDEERDTYCIYWMTKIWLALQLRADILKDKSTRTKVNLFIDELYQVHHTEEFLKEKLSRLAKFRLKPIISCHYLNQIKIIRDELRSANASYMLISGCDKKNFQELKEELYPFDTEDLLSLPRFHSMNLIKSKGGYERFITDLTNIGK